MAARLFAIDDFRRLWYVAGVICIVRWLEMLALALYAYQITGSAFIVAMLPLVRMLPLTLFGAVMGAFAERFERRRALVLLLSMSVATTLALAVLATFGTIAVWHLLVASFVGGITWAADHPVRRMMIGDVVGGDQLAAALSIDSATNNGSRVIGPMLGGLLLAHYGIASVFWFNAALYAVGLWALLRSTSRRQIAGTAISILASMREGFAWARRDPRLIGIFAMTIIFNVFGWSCTSMIPVIATDYLRLDPQGVGVLAACEGVGGLMGALLLANFTRQAWYGRVYVGALTLYLILLVVFALSSIVPVAAAALFLVGACGAGFAVMQVTLVYRFAPIEMRARLLGVVSVCIGSGPIGYFYLGVLADVFSPSGAVIALAAQGMLAIVFTRRYWSATLRH